MPETEGGAAAATMPSQLLGQLETFDATTDTVAAYDERAQLFFSVNSIPEPKQVPVLLNAIGKSNYELLRNLSAPAAPSSKTYKQVVDMLKSHFEPKPLVIAERFQFHRRQQGKQESVSDYVAELRKLSLHCEFGEYLDQALRDRFVCGLRSEAVQKRLLTEADLTFSHAVQVAQSCEQAAVKAKQLQNLPEATPLEVGRVSTQKPQGGAVVCYRCGKANHKADKCTHKATRCYKCNKLGHLAAVCGLKPHKAPAWQKRRGAPSKRQIRTVEEIPDQVVEEFEQIGTVRSEPGKPLLVDVTLNKKPLTMEVDTRAAVSLVSEDTYRSLLSDQELEPTQTSLRTFSGEPITVLGQIHVLVEYSSQKAKLPLYVVKGSSPNLFGRNWLFPIRLDWSEIQTVTSSLQDVLDRHKSVFDESLGELKGFQAKIYVDPEAKPKFCKARPVPYALRELVDKEIDRLLSEGVISPVEFSEWAAPVVPVVKRDKKSLRLCGDFKMTVNKASHLDRYPIPKIEDLFAKLAGGKVFSKLDLSQAYQQVVLDEESRKYTVINTHRGLFKYNRLPFGVSSAPGIFQRLMESMLSDLEGVTVYIDDVLIAARDEEEHLAKLEEVFRRFSKSGLHLKLQKCLFLVPSVEYLGYVIDAEGLHPTPEKTRAIQEAPVPLNVAELKSYLGLLCYYSKFLRNLSTLLAPLYELCRRDQLWQWSERQEEAFRKSKELLLSSQVLIHFDPKLEILLACDASKYGIGAVLSHKLPDGSEKPVAFMSRTLSEAEKKYSQIEKEALACVEGVTRFHSYLFGHHFILQTDHKPLITLLNESKPIPEQAASRIQRWAWRLASYEYTITWRATDKHANADALSRLPLLEAPATTEYPAEYVLMLENMEEAPVNARQIAKWTSQDPVTANVYRYTQAGWPEKVEDERLKPYWHRRLELSTVEGCLVWGSRIVIPPQGREMMLEELHGGHPGCTRMKAVARGLLWWPSLDRDIESKVKSCTSCQQCQPSPPSAPLHPWVWPTRPWSRLHIDYAGPMSGKMCLVVVDAHSKWIEVCPVTSATSLTTIQQLRQLFARFGIPESIVSDNGTQFTSKEFQDFCKSNGIRHILVSPYHPSSNGLAERAVKTFKQGVKKQSQGTLFDQIARFLFHYRNTPHSTTGRPPAELLLGRKLRSRLDLIRPDIERSVLDKQFRQKIDHDQSSRERKFAVGEKVYVKNHRSGQRWLCGEIVKSTGPVSYEVLLEDKTTIRGHQDHIRSRQSPREVPQTNIEGEEFIDVPSQPGPDQSASSSSGDDQTANEEDTQVRRYPTRERRAPNYFGH